MFGLRWVRVSGHSMEPTLRPGEHLLVDLRAYAREPPRRGDLVLVEPPGATFRVVKRIAGVPGDWVGGRRLGPDEFDVRGDNPGHSRDSGLYGPVGRARILGRVARRLPSLRRIPSGSSP